MNVRLICRKAIHDLKNGDIVDAEINGGNVSICGKNIVLSPDCADEHFTAYPVSLTDNGYELSLSNYDFGVICICAARYAIGRMTLPETVCGFLKGIVGELNMRTVCCIERDIREAHDYGDSQNKDTWMEMLAACRKVMTEKGYEPWI